MKNFDSLRVPKYVQLMFRLREQIEEGTLKQGNPLPTREKLMREFDLSLSTVTRAISELERQGWLISRQGSGTFVKQRTKNSKSDHPDTVTVGLLFPLDRTDENDLVLELVHEAQEQNIHLQVMYAPSSEDQELNQARILLDQGVQGLIWFPIGKKKHVSVASLFGKNRIPVILGENVTNRMQPSCFCVRSDYYGGTLKALTYLCELGHKHIAYVGPRGTNIDFGPIMERWFAFKDFVKQHALFDPDQFTLSADLIDEWPIHGPEVEAFFQQNRPTALLAYNDKIALEISERLSVMGYQIPEDIAIIGHGDSSYGIYSSPRLTTVSPCATEYADAVIQALKTMMEQTESPIDTEEDSREKVVPQRLITRNSSLATNNVMIEPS